MKLADIYKALSDISLEQPNIKTVVLNDVYLLNEMKNGVYSVFAVTQNQHRQDSDYRYYNLNLYYIDRLLEDTTNDINIQSTGIEVLSNIITTFINQYYGQIDVNGDLTYQSFTQKFIDETAGVYVRVEFALPLDSLCEENY